MKVNFLVVDSGPIIKGAVLEKFSKHAISVPGVIKEIKDLKTRERMRNLPPYFFSIKSPSDKAITHVINVSKITGDCKVLSKVDIEVLALAYEMQYLKTPEQVSEMFEKCELDSDASETDEIPDTNNDFFKANADYDDDSESIESIDVTDSEEEQDDNLESELNALEIIDDEDVENNSNDNNIEEVSSYPSFDDPRWISEDNYEQMKAFSFGMDASSTEKKEKVSIDELEETPIIGCLTTDYAMQNVLLKMNIAILSVDGMVIKEPRIFVSYCRSCFNKFKRADIFFCPHCGNENLGKVPAIIEENGEIKLFLRKNFTPNLRNTKFSIPTPKGGRHRDGNFYIYCADQKVPMERAKKSKFTFNVNEEGNVPFMMHDETARSSILGINQQRNKNLKPSRPKGNRCARLKK